MNTSKAYDLPLRIFHWSFALLFILSFSIGKFVDDESYLYGYHMLSGILMVLLILLRIIWGFLGSRTSKFSSFKLCPSQLKNYFATIFSSPSKRYLGHNPASSYSAMAMLLLPLGMGFTGLMMIIRFNKHFFKETHELMAHGLLVIVILHVGGVLLHQYKHKDGLFLSMITGKKKIIEGESEISSHHPATALVFLFIISFLSTILWQSYDSTTGELSILNSQFQLGEKQLNHDKESSHSPNLPNDDDDDD